MSALRGFDPQWPAGEQEAWRLGYAAALAAQPVQQPAPAIEALRRIREAGNNSTEWAVWAQKTAAWGMQTGYCPEQPAAAPVAAPVAVRVASVQPVPDDLFDLIREWAHLPEGQRGQAARKIIGCVNRSYSAGVADGRVLGALAAVQPARGRDAALVAAVNALAWKWHREAVKDGFACSEPAQELFEVLGWPADPAMPAPAK